MIEENEFQRRINNVIGILKAKKLKATLIYYDELNIGNGWYLSGWCPQFESGSILLTDDGNSIILGGPESEPFAKMDSTIKETKNIPVFMVPDEEYPYASIVDFKTVFKEVFGTARIDRLGVVGMGSMPLGVYNLLIEEMEGVELVEITEEYEELRIHKSVYEVGLIKKASQINDEGFKEMLANVREGVSEVFLAGTGEGICRRFGANRFGFQTIVGAGERSNGVVPTATERKLKKGEMVMLGLSARYEGYASAAGVSVVVGGKPDDKQRDYIKMISEAYLISRGMLKPGMVGRDNYAKIKKYFSNKGGYEKYIICPFIHTIGLYEAEAPFYGPNSDDVLEPGMTVCIDTSLFGHPSLNGIRMESGYVITNSGCEPLSPYVDKMIEDQINI